MTHPNATTTAPPAARLEVPDEYDVLARSILDHLASRPGQLAAPAAPAPVASELEAVRPAHILAEHDRWPWLPTPDHGHLARHPFCEGCGGVRYMGSLRPMKLGALVNLAARLAERLRADGRTVTEAQFRLVMQRLTREHADDTFVISRPMQEHILLASFARCTGIDDGTLRSYFRLL